MTNNLVKLINRKENIMRYIKGVLTPETLNQLTRIYQSSKFPQVRTRALCIKLSNQGYTINELIEIFKVSRNTIYNWFNNFEKMALAGLYNNQGCGRKNILNKAQITKIKEWVEAEPNSFNNRTNKIKEEWQITISKDTIKRTLKKQKMNWKRLRRLPGKKPEPKLYEHKLKAIEKLKILEEQEKLEIRYGDESGFSLISSLPYAWARN